MLPEVIGLLGVLLVLTLIGLGPALHVLGAGPRRLALALPLAPAVGYTILCLLAFPLARWVAPVQVWAWPASLVLLAGSGLLVVVAVRQQPLMLEAGGLLRLGIGAALVLGGLAILARPLLQFGLQFAVYRGNPSDALLYTSLAETLHTVRWTTLSNGVSLTTNNLAGLQALAEASPTAVFTARMVGLPLALNKMGFMAWAATIAGVPVYRFYYAHHVVALVVAATTALALGQQLNLKPLLRYGAAGAIALGFWAHFLLEADAGYEISAIPLLLLAMYGWALSEQVAEKWLSGGRVLLAAACAASLGVYFPVLLIIGIAGGLYYVVGVLQGAVSWRGAAMHLVTVAMAAGLLALTGQLDYDARNVLYLISRADSERIFEPLVLNALRRDGLAGLWGFSAAAVTQALPGRLRWPVEQVFTLLGAGLTAVAGLGLGIGFRRSTSTAQRIVTAVVLAGGILAAAMVLRDNERAAGKAITYILPSLYLLAATAANQLDYILVARWQPLARTTLAAAFALQAGLGLVWPTQTLLPTQRPVAPKAWQFDISPVQAYLRAHPPQQLLVSIPRQDDAATPESWTFAYYVMFPLSEFHPYFQSGIIVDNSLASANLWLQAPVLAPDYAIVLKSADYLASANVGELVAETDDLRLYHLTDSSAAVLAAEEARLRQVEAAKSPVP